MAVSASYGVIVYLDALKFYGFVADDRGSTVPHLFFHKANLRFPAVWEHLRIGSKVVFRPTAHERGMRAEDVSLRDDAPGPW